MAFLDELERAFAVRPDEALDSAAPSLSLVRRLKTHERALPNGATVHGLVALLDVSMLPAAWAEDSTGLLYLSAVVDRLRELVGTLGVKVKTTACRGAYAELTIPRSAVRRLQPLVDEHRRIVGEKAGWARAVDPAWQTYAERGLSEFEAGVPGPTKVDAAPKAAKTGVATAKAAQAHDPEITRWIRTGVYVRASQATVAQIQEALDAFLEPFGEKVDADDGPFDAGSFKQRGALGIAVFAPAPSKSGDAWIGVVHSTPREEWLMRFAQFLYARLGADLFAYWVGTPKQAVGESLWLTADGTKKSASWKRIVAELETMPNTWMKFGDLGPEHGAIRSAYVLDRDRFGHAVEFGSPHWS